MAVCLLQPILYNGKLVEFRLMYEWLIRPEIASEAQGILFEEQSIASDSRRSTRVSLYGRRPFLSVLIKRLSKRLHGNS